MFQNEKKLPLKYNQLVLILYQTITSTFLLSFGKHKGITQIKY